MIKTLLALFTILLISIQAIAQERVISGVLNDEEGLPMPGVNVVIKGTGTGTVTDLDGYYSITVEVGQTLIFSGVGLETREIIIGPTIKRSSTTPKDSLGFSFQEFKQLSDSLSGKGEKTGAFTDQMPNFSFKDDQKRNMINNLYGIEKKSKNNYYFDTNPQKKYNPYFHVNFQSIYSVQVINRLPDLQSRFAQGSPENGVNTWRGAESGEVFSWGPAINTLEFTGKAYDFDKNGTLSSLGSGNGQSANVYRPKDFFQQGFNWQNSIQISKRMGKHYLFSSVQYGRESGIIPNNNKEQVKLDFKYRVRLFGKHQLTNSLFYQNSKEQLPIIGANWQSIIGAVYRTPATFDNANGLSARDAVKNNASYLLPNGNFRSHSPGSVDNPYALVNTIPDERKTDNLLASISDEFRIWKISVSADFGLQLSNSHTRFGLPPNSAGSAQGRYTDRKEDIKSFFAKWASDIWIIGKNGVNALFKLDYQFKQEENTLNRTDAAAFPVGAGFDINQAGSVSTVRFNKERNTHEIFTNFDLKVIHEALHILFGNQLYISSTLKPKNQAYFLPNVSLSFDIFELIRNPPNGDLRLSASYSKNIREAPLIYNQWHYNSTNLNAVDYTKYAQSQEILLYQNIQAETSEKLDVRLNFSRNRFYVEANYFLNNTSQLIVPVLQNGIFALDNVGNLRNQGFEASLSYHLFYYYNNQKFNWFTKFNFTSYRPVITKLNNSTPIPIAGYKDISANLIENQPFGVLVGSVYERNSSGELIIDNNGYPKVDPNPKVLGNPNPDFIMNWSNEFRFFHFPLSIDCEYKKGGVMWNGTQNAFNYLGVSQATAQQRSTMGYIFSGVNSSGQVNQVAVDFANPVNGLTDNRWVRYGWSGVAEDAIQDASWLRINEIRLKYNFSRWWEKLIGLNKSEFKLSVYTRNILLYTPYSGIDPMATLLNYKQGLGLDLFNLPGTVTYGIQLDLHF